MTKVVTPSTITESQIGKVVELISAKLRKSGLPKEAVQHVLKTQGGELAEEFLARFCGCVELQSDWITRAVTVDRTRSPQQVLDGIGRKQTGKRDVVATMPKGTGDTVKVVFFPLSCCASDDQVESELAKRGLVACDPLSLAQVNADDPAFADSHKNFTQWRDKDGRWCYAVFATYCDGRTVYVGHDGYMGVRETWWVAGLRRK